MERTRINTLYSLLININVRMVFEDFYSYMLNTGKVLVNGKQISPDNINMTIYAGDVITCQNEKYLVGLEQLERMV